MILYLLLLALGVILLVGGGDALVRGASNLAKALGISPLIVGLTVVAFGTSAPELAVNTLAALRQQSEISFGNIIGSNFANLGLILGCCALVRPLEIRGRVTGREIPMMLLATAAAVVMALDPWLRGEAALYDRAEGIFLLLLFLVFLYYLTGDILRERQPDALVEQANVVGSEDSPPTLWLSVVLTIVGLLGLVGGGELTVHAATELARALEVPEVIIGLTLIALGTSLPELVTGVLATLKGQTDLAIGNVVGSNIFNLLLVKGVTAVVQPIEVPERGLYDLIAVSVISLILFPMTITNQRRLMRWEGAALLLAYFGYTGWRVFG